MFADPESPVDCKLVLVATALGTFGQYINTYAKPEGPYCFRGIRSLNFNGYFIATVARWLIQVFGRFESGTT